MPCRLDVHLLDLRAVPPLGEAALARLSPDERSRWRTYREPMAARRFAAARLALREVLASHDRSLATDGTGLASPWRFEVGPRGKPRLAGRPWPRFNLSHAADRVAIACCDTHEVGIDVERPAAFVGSRSLWRSTCSADEQAWLAAQPPDVAARAFGRLWTCKEALAKAVGEGLRWPFAEIDLAGTLDDASGRLAHRLPPAVAGEEPLDDDARQVELRWFRLEGADVGDGPAVVAVMGRAGDAALEDCEPRVHRLDANRLFGPA